MARTQWTLLSLYSIKQPVKVKCIFRMKFKIILGTNIGGLGSCLEIGGRDELALLYLKANKDQEKFWVLFPLSIR